MFKKFQDSLLLPQWRPVRIALLAVYYLLIIAGPIVLYGRGDFSTPPFVYQGF